MIEASAPSNIALIKYMGKTASGGNDATNPSLSYSLPHLVTQVRLVPRDEGPDRWAPLEKPGFVAPELTERGREKFVNHFRFLKEQLGGAGSYEIQSANNFPADCGLASSASSFAALTLAAAKAFDPTRSAGELSRLSRRGSGSSCRSIFSPWALWRGEGAEAVDLGIPELLHAAVVVSAGRKEVSSSEAHQRVATSPRFAGRVDRAVQRLEVLVGSLRGGDWRRAFEVCRDEFVDMHELFETSVPGFAYRTRDSQNVVDACQHIWNFKADGPLVTMDAGPNVHLLFRPEQRDLADKMIDHFKTKHVVMTSWRGLR